MPTTRANRDHDNMELLPDLLSEIIRSVRSRIFHAVATLALLVCFICPVLEMCDRWDHTLQTGQDTEYTFVVLALCVGALYAFARLIVTVYPSPSATKYISTLCCLKRSLFLVICPTALAAFSESPPLNLRI
jgi:hypothetical protein